jgi:hypothetical protein
MRGSFAVLVAATLLAAVPLGIQLEAKDSPTKRLGPPGLDRRPQEAPPAPPDDTDPMVTAGVHVVCWFQFIPGVEGAEFPAPKPYKGAIVRLFPLKGDKVLQQGKTTESGGLRLPAQPGQYRLEIVPCEAGEGVQSPLKVTVEKDKLTKVKITITRPGV